MIIDFCSHKYPLPYACPLLHILLSPDPDRKTLSSRRRFIASRSLAIPRRLLEIQFHFHTPQTRPGGINYGVW